MADAARLATTKDKKNRRAALALCFAADLPALELTVAVVRMAMTTGGENRRAALALDIAVGPPVPEPKAAAARMAMIRGMETMTAGLVQGITADHPEPGLLKTVSQPAPPLPLMMFSSIERSAL